MKIVLINPPYEKLYKNVSYTNGVIPPLGIIDIASYIIEKGFCCEIIDANALRLTVDETINRVLGKKPDIVGITSTTASYKISSEIIRKVKDAKSNIMAVIGGAHASACGHKILAEASHFDIAVRGEGELAFASILASFHSKNFAAIKGIVFRDKENNIISTELNEANIDISLTPLPAYDLLPMERYKTPLHHSGFGRKIPDGPFFMIFTGRGCPMKCNFCACSTIWGNKVRLKTPERVMEEIDFLVKKYKIKVLDIADDIFTINKDRLHKILDLIISRNYELYFNCNSRADTIDEYDLKKLKAAGCYLIRYGIESGSQEILNNMNKKISIGKIKKTIELTHLAGIDSSASYILGYPGETKQSALQTITLAKQLKTAVSLFFFAIPYEGTVLHDFAQKNNFKIDGNPESWINFPDKPVLNIPTLSPSELIGLRKKAYFKVYFDFKLILARVRSINNFRTFLIMLKAGLSVIKLISGKRRVK